jgi:hypothetical protein
MRNSKYQSVRSSARSLWLAAITLLTISMSGCSSPPPAADKHSEVMVVPVRFGDIGGDVISSKERPVKAITIFAAIPGAINGSAPGPNIAVPIDAVPALSINLPELQAYMRQHSTTITAPPLAGVTTTLNVDPADTRFARVAHLVRYESAPRPPGATRFVDSGSKNNLYLVYFDRPCHLTGTVSWGGAEPGARDFDVTIEEAGLNWLAATPKGPGDVSVVHHATLPVRPVFVIEYK